MGGHGGSFRTTVGEVTVDGDAIRINEEPRAHVRRQLSRWRHGKRWGRVRAALRLAAILLVPPFILFRLAEAWDTYPAGMLAFVLTMSAIHIASMWRQYTRETEIPRSNVSGVTLDTDERELKVRFDAGSLLRPPDGVGIKTYRSDDQMRLFETGETERTMTLLTDDDVRDARSAFHLAGVSVDENTEAGESGRYDGETETEYRVTTRKGAVFCDDCGSQVSPSDRACPSCDYTLRVDRLVEDDQRETTLEY